MMLFKTQHPAGLVKPIGFAAGLFIFTHTAFGQATVPTSLANALAKNIPQVVIVLFDGDAVQTGVLRRF